MAGGFLGGRGVFGGEGGTRGDLGGFWGLRGGKIFLGFSCSPQVNKSFVEGRNSRGMGGST